MTRLFLVLALSTTAWAGSLRVQIPHAWIEEWYADTAVNQGWVEVATPAHDKYSSRSPIERFWDRQAARQDRKMLYLLDQVFNNQQPQDCECCL